MRERFVVLGALFLNMRISILSESVRYIFSHFQLFLCEILNFLSCSPTTQILQKVITYLVITKPTLGYYTDRRESVLFT